MWFSALQSQQHKCSGLGPVIKVQTQAWTNNLCLLYEKHTSASGIFVSCGLTRLLESRSITVLFKVDMLPDWLKIAVQADSLHRWAALQCMPLILKLKLLPIPICILNHAWLYTIFLSDDSVDMCSNNASNYSAPSWAADNIPCTQDTDKTCCAHGCARVRCCCRMVITISDRDQSGHVNRFCNLKDGAVSRAAWRA